MRILPVLLLLLFVSTARAEFTLEVYDKVKNEDRVKAYFTGFGRGMIWANAGQEKWKLFCVPSNLGMDEAIIHSIIKQEIEKPSNGKTYDLDTPVEFIALKALMTRFPCDK